MLWKGQDRGSRAHTAGAARCVGSHSTETVRPRTNPILVAAVANESPFWLELWGLPAPIVDAVAWHHKPSDSPTQSFSPLTAVHVLAGGAAEPLEQTPGVSLGSQFQTVVQEGIQSGLGLTQPFGRFPIGSAVVSGKRPSGQGSRCQWLPPEGAVHGLEDLRRFGRLSENAADPA